jgi:hypothetical protein
MHKRINDGARNGHCAVRLVWDSKMNVKGSNKGGGGQEQGVKEVTVPVSQKT